MSTPGVFATRAGARRRNVPAMKMVKPNHDALHQAAGAVPTDELASLQDLAGRMLATLRCRGNGVALAAPQVGVATRLVVTTGWKGLPRILVNPRIVGRIGVEQQGVEGCLTFPGKWWVVPRHLQVLVVGEQLDGTTIELTTPADVPLIARMWQHEIDHLDGLVLQGRYPAAR